VIQATDGQDGLAQAARSRPALIITDINMPRLSGFDLLRQVGQDAALKTVPVIIISALADRSDLRRGMELGAADYISKPFTEDEVIKAVRTQLAKKELIDELDAFAHTVAHDLKNPIATLNMRLELLERLQANPDPSALGKSTREAQRAADRLDLIVDNLLILSGVRRLQVAAQAFDMGTVVGEALDQLSALLHQHHVSVEAPDSWPPAFGHPPWVVHVWVNYLSNAVRYAAQGGRVTLGFSAGRGSARTRFWVQDYGPGIPADQLAMLFIPFRQVGIVRNRRRGLGLSIVHRIVEKLGGAAGVENTPGAGARFWFELPRESSGVPSRTELTPNHPEAQVIPGR